MAVFSRSRVETAVVALLTTALGVLAFTHKGLPAAEVDLNDGGLWVTNESLLMVGHVNYESRTIDGGFLSASSKFDVSQSAANVLVTRPDDVLPVDVATVSTTGQAKVSGIKVAHNGDTVLFADSGEGRVWATNTTGAGTFSSTAVPLIKDLSTPSVVVGTDGVGHVVTSEGLHYVVTAGENGFEVTDKGKAVDAALSENAQLSALGGRLVVLDQGVLTVGEKKITSDLFTDAVLQQPSGDSKEVLLATAGAFLQINIESGQISRDDVPAGKPAAPIQVGGCAHGLWSGSGYYLRDCDDGDFAKSQHAEIAEAAKPVFRFNRKAVAINDTASGLVLLPLQGMERVDNWELIRTQLQEDKQVQKDEVDDTRSQVKEFTDEQHAPEAKDDILGARPGTSTTLPVLLNDNDADGDVLTAIIEPGTIPEGVAITTADEGRQVRIQVPPEASGEYQFSYRAFDGIDKSNVATVKVQIRAPGENSPPKRERRSPITVAERASYEYSVLGDWVDPDGDPIFLANAATEQDLEVSWRPDGYVAIKDLGRAGPGRRSVNVSVSDGKAAASDPLDVVVVAASTNSPPVANNDHFVASRGETITLEPLLNDTDADADPLTLVELQPAPSGLTATADYQTGRITFNSTQAGSFTFIYAISDGAHTAKGRIRIDVLDPEAEKIPRAENDLALLPSNGAVVLDVLGNDRDPTGGVLVVQGISMGSAEGLNAEVIQHARLRISATSALSEPQTIEYTVSNGFGSTSAKVLVVPREASGQTQPPVAVADQGVVRAGDIVTVPVLENDYSPSDLDFTLEPELDVRSDPALGTFFVSDRTVRFRASGEPGTAEALYTIRDGNNLVATGTVTITINSYNDTNREPVPTSVEARTFTSKTLRIPISMEGIDPDGDFVQLVGLGQKAPQYGSVAVDGNALVYTASSSATGTDTFSYRVADQFGAEGEGTVRVGVAPAPSLNQAPVAVTDSVSARPATQLEIPAIANDIDPDGDQIQLVPDSVQTVDGAWDPKVSIAGQKIHITTPERAGEYRLVYSIRDSGGTPVQGLIVIHVDPNVPPVKPIARDDYVPEAGINDRDSVEVEVLANDSDPDGAVSDLKVTAESPATVRRGVVKVPIKDERQVILYTVTDPDGLTAQAAVVVPGRQRVRPQINQDRSPARVVGGQKLVIELSEYVVTRPGTQAALTRAESVIAGPGGNTSLPNAGLEVVDKDTIYFTPGTGFSGATSVSFEVTDGASDDTNAYRATLSLPIVVESSGKSSPTVRPNEVQVGAGEGSVTANLASMVSDPDPGDNERMTYKLLETSEGITAKVDGQSMQVQASANLTPGTEGSVAIEVSDGSTEPVKMSVPIKVLKSTKPLMQVTELRDNNARVGQASTFNILDAVTNPFADEGGAITLVGSPIVTRGAGTIEVDGTIVKVTPTGDSVEEVVVSYRVADATKDPARERNGQLILRVKSRPDAPTGVTAQALKSRTARVSWTAADWRGGTPDGFTVRWDGGEKACGLQTTCDITGLSNARAYTFTVVARVKESDLEASKPSEPSNEVWIDAIPDVPDAPVASAGDGLATVTWNPVTTPDGGSPVTYYTVTIDPADASGRTEMKTSGTSVVWDRLSNGTAYTFRVRANNKLTDEDSRVQAPASSPSNTLIPFGPPSGQGAPTVTMNAPIAGVTPQATISWDAPSKPNGNSDFKFEVRESGGNTVCTETSARQCTVSMSVGTADRTFEVRVTNASGTWSEWSPPSNKVRAFQPPGPPGAFSVTPTNNGHEAVFNFTPAAGNGIRDDELSYEWHIGSASGTVSNGQTITTDALAFGKPISVSLNAVGTVNGQRVAGEAITTTVTVSGPPAAPVVSAKRNDSLDTPQVDVSWEMPEASNGAKVTGVKVTVTIDGVPQTPGVGLNGTLTRGGKPNQQVCITAQATNEHGKTGPQSETKCATTRPPAATIAAGQQAACPDGVTGNCYAARVELRDWTPSSTVACDLQGAYGLAGEVPFTVDASGDWAGDVDPEKYKWVLYGSNVPSSPQSIAGKCH